MAESFDLGVPDPGELGHDLFRDLTDREIATNLSAPELRMIPLDLAVENITDYLVNEGNGAASLDDLWLAVRVVLQRVLDQAVILHHLMSITDSSTTTGE